MTHLLTSAELWVLSYAVEAKMPLGVYGAREFDEILNCNRARFSRDQVSRAISSLCERKLIALGRRGPASPVMIEEPHLDGLDAKLDERPPYLSYLWLTSEGGSAWEDYFQPDWSKFMLVETDARALVLSITCQTPLLIARYRAALQEDVGGESMPVIEEPVASWSPTYWKTLSGGQRVRFLSPRERSWMSTSVTASLAMSHLVSLWRQVGFR